MPLTQRGQYPPGALTQAAADARYLRLNGENIEDNITEIGDIDHQLAKLHFGRSTPALSNPRANLHGLHWLDASGGDFFVGSDPEFPDFYVQKTVKSNSTVNPARSEEATNFFQGNWGNGATPAWPFLQLNFDVGDGSVGAYTIMGEDDLTYVRDGAVDVGYYGGSRGGGGFIIYGRFSGGAGLYIVADETGGQSGRGDMVFRTMSTGKAAGEVNTISFAGTRLTVVRAKSDDVVALGDTTHRFTNLFFTGKLNWSAAPTYTPSNVTTDRSYDANATTVDELADVVGTLIADLKTLGVLV